jgi:hypothetical protein
MQLVYINLEDNTYDALNGMIDEYKKQGINICDPGVLIDALISQASLSLMKDPMSIIMMLGLLTMKNAIYEKELKKERQNDKTDED